MQALQAEPLTLCAAPAISAEAVAESELPSGYSVLVKTGKDHELGQSETPGITYQKCGGGRRILRNRIKD